MHMPRNEWTKEEYKVFLLKLKNELYHEDFSDGITWIAHKYLDKALQKLDEYRY